MFFVFIVSIDIAIHAHSFTVIGSVSMRTGSGIACNFATKHVVAVSAHALCIVLCAFMFAICNFSLWPSTFSCLRFLLSFTLSLLTLSYNFLFCLSWWTVILFLLLFLSLRHLIAIMNSKIDRIASLMVNCWLSQKVFTRRLTLDFGRVCYSFGCNRSRTG